MGSDVPRPEQASPSRRRRGRWAFGLAVVVALLALKAVIPMRGIECRAVGEAFFTAAPRRYRYQAELDVSAAEAFRVLEDPASWPRWFPGIRRVEWTSPRPFGVGTTRTVTLGSATVYERFFRWEQGRRFSFYFTAHDAAIPLFRALAEDYEFEDLPGDRSRFTYRVALEPSVYFRALWPFAGPSMEDQFRRAPEALAQYVRAHRGG